MNETLLLILTWLPVVAESGLFVALIKVLAKKMKEHFSMPEKIAKEVKELRSSTAALNSQCATLIEENRKLLKQNEKLYLQLKGIKNYDEEVSKN